MAQETILNNQDQHFLEMAQDHSLRSKDPSTRSGTVIVSPDQHVLTLGYNGFPSGVAETPERLNHRETKYKLIVHSELNAILAAAALGIRLQGSTLYVVSTSRMEGFVWGGPPCIRCCVELIQAGIAHIRVPFQSPKVREEWKQNFVEARELLIEAGIDYEEVAWTGLQGL